MNRYYKIGSCWIAAWLGIFVFIAGVSMVAPYVFSDYAQGGPHTLAALAIVCSIVGIIYLLCGVFKKREDK